MNSVIISGIVFAFFAYIALVLPAAFARLEERLWQFEGANVEDLKNRVQRLKTVAVLAARVAASLAAVFFCYRLYAEFLSAEFLSMRV